MKWAQMWSLQQGLAYMPMYIRYIQFVTAWRTVSRLVESLSSRQGTCCGSQVKQKMSLQLALKECASETVPPHGI